jgi:sulfur-oxidizing protein SoxZ
MATPTPRVRMPAAAKAGEVIEVKTLISHEMESGNRKDKDGKVIPRKIIKAFAAKFNGKEIFRADWHPAISANPYQSFFVAHSSSRGSTTMAPSTRPSRKSRSVDFRYWPDSLGCQVFLLLEICKYSHMVECFMLG